MGAISGESCRRGAVLGLQWQDVSFAEGRALIRRAIVHGVLGTPKSGKARSVVLSPLLAGVLRDLHAQRRRETLKRGWPEVPEWVFCDRNSSPLDERNLHRT